jgi:ceramide glucosyltransferase
MFWNAIPPALAGLWLFWMAQAAWCCFNAWSFIARARRMEGRLERTRDFHPPTAVVMPIKGADADLPAHLDQLRRQEFPEYRLIFVVESQQDAAHAVISSLISSAGNERPEMELVVAGLAERGGQKVHNLLAGVAALRERDAVVAFADADASAHPAWLLRLVRVLGDKDVGVSTGYRWFVPTSEQGDLPSCLASIINGSVGGLLGRPRYAFAWGGSMAMRREVVAESKLLEYWDGALSDDYQLSWAVRATGRVIRFVPRCLVVSPSRFTWGSLLEFSRRQYLITRVHVPLIWLVALLATGAYTMAWACVVAALLRGVSGAGWGLAAWAAVWAADLMRAHFRAVAAEMLLDAEALPRLRRVAMLERWATPLWMAVHFVLVLRSVFGRRICWGGITYEMRGPRDVRIVSRG